MKNKLMAVFMVAAFLVVSVTGCGSQEVSDDSLTQITVSDTVEESAVQDTVMQDVTESSEDVVEESIQEVEESIVEDTTPKDWKTYYNAETIAKTMPQDNVSMNCVASGNGASIIFEMAMAGENFRVFMDLGKTSIDVYTTEEMVYAYADMGSSQYWRCAKIISSSDINSITSMGDDTMSAVELEGEESFTYVKEVEENDIVYDVISVPAEDEEGTLIYYYVNREKQRMEKFTMDKDGVEMVCTFTEIQSIEIPAEAEEALLCRMTDITALFDDVMYAGIYD